MKVKEIMTKSVASLKPEDSIKAAAEIMREYNVGSVPVCDNANNVIGIITDRDIVLRSVADEQSTRQVVRDVMTSNPVLGNPDMDIHDAARVMSERQIRRLPIVENKSLVGIVALGDIAVEPKLQDNAEDALNNISRPSTPMA